MKKSLTGLFLGISFYFLFSFCVLVLVSFAQSRYNDPSVLLDPTGYKLRVGDTLRILVRGEPDCTLEAKINNDGNLRLVYLGENPIGRNNRQTSGSKNCQRLSIKPHFQRTDY